METWAQSTSWDVSEAIPEHSVSGHRQMRRSLAGPGVGAPGVGRREGAAPDAKLPTHLVQAHTHTAGSVSPNSKFSGGDSPGKFPAPAGLREKEAQAGPKKNITRLCLSKPPGNTCLRIPNALVHNAGSWAPTPTLLSQNPREAS